MQLEGGTELLALDASKELLIVAGLGLDDVDSTKIQILDMGELLSDLPILTAQSVKKLKKESQNPAEFFKDLVEENGQIDSSDEETESIVLSDEEEDSSEDDTS